MDRPTPVFLALRSLISVSLTGLGLVALSSVGGLTGFAMAIGALYMALFASVSHHRPGG